MKSSNLLSRIMINMLILTGLLLPQKLEAVDLVTYDDHTPALVYALVGTAVTLGVIYWFAANENRQTPEETYAAVHPEEYLFSEQQLREFNGLTDDTQIISYIDTFWKSNDPTPLSLRNESRDEFAADVEYTNAAFAEPNLPGWLTDRGRFFLLHGKPDQIKHENFGSKRLTSNSQFELLHRDSKQNTREPLSATLSSNNIEIWYYNRPAGGNHIPLVFDDFSAGGMFAVFEDQNWYGHFRQIFSTELESEAGKN